MTALPDRSEDVGGVEDLPESHFDYEVGGGGPVCGCSRCTSVGTPLTYLPIDDEGIDRIAAQLSPKPRTAWKGRAVEAEAALAEMTRTARFWRHAAHALAAALGILGSLLVAGAFK